MSPRRPPPPGKRARLRAQQRRRRRRQLLAAASVVAVLGLVAALLVALGGEQERKPGAEPQRTQRTLLLQVQQADRTSTSSALLAHDPRTTSGSVVLVPPQVLAPVPGFGNVPFGRALSLGEPVGAVTGARNALADLLGVTVDGSWVLDVASFRRLVNELGGIRVTVDASVLRGRSVVLAPGAQRLDGPQAEQYASYLAEGEQEQARLARLQAVLDGILTALPEDLEPLLASLGPGSRSTLALPELSTVLTGLQAANGAQDLQYRSLPVLPVSATDEQVLFRVDAPAAKTLVTELLAASVPPGATSTGNRVLVLNGVGTPGLGAQVRENLVQAGFVFAGSRNAPSFDYAKTEVLVKEATPDGAELGARVARALGLPDASVMASDQIGTSADVVVIIGRDFQAR